MAKIITHRFASPKTDGPDPTQIQPSNWNDGHLLIGGVAGDVLTRDPTDATFGGKWVTPIAGVPMPGGGASGDVLTRDTTIPTYGAKWVKPGVWNDIPYNATNFTGAGGMGWTVQAGDQLTFAYLLENQLGIVIFNLAGTDVTGVAGTPLTILCPITPQRAQESLCWGLDNGIATVVRVRIIAGDPRLYLYRLDAANWTVNPGNTNVSGQVIVRLA